MLALDPDGFLIEPDHWEPTMATTLAHGDGITLSSDHWKYIDFIRKFYQEFEFVPPMRIFIKEAAANLGPELGNSLSLHQLFPTNPLKLLCKYAGLPKPKHCM